jgi:flagellar protein FliJ
MTQSLNTVLWHAEQQRDQALAELQRAEERVLAMQQQAEQLHSYRADTRQRWQGATGRTSAIELVHCTQHFMQRLDQALAQQQAQVNSAQAGCQRVRDKLLALELRVASVRKLMQRRGAEAQQVQQRQDQRRNDEFARRRPWRATATGTLL